ncbi:hypothetical protein EVG20_g6518 [Dentipellis fragilis]|uniref:Uncharacterized protein n=1 Tax=Dentipellis fragilis TaxID=205917 RepID=A0A4Y9YK67_9AGAM|nr:hypothetical protein EVG20_g6518 [Dentipellis fragilis]
MHRVSSSRVRHHKAGLSACPNTERGCPPFGSLSTSQRAEGAGHGTAIFLHVLEPSIFRVPLCWAELRTQCGEERLREAPEHSGTFDATSSPSGSTTPTSRGVSAPASVIMSTLLGAARSIFTVRDRGGYVGGVNVNATVPGGVLRLLQTSPWSPDRCPRSATCARHRRTSRSREEAPPGSRRDTLACPSALRVGAEHAHTRRWPLAVLAVDLPPGPASRVWTLGIPIQDPRRRRSGA